MLYYLLFVVFLLALCWLLPRIGFVKKSGLPGPLIIGLFVLKVLAGILLGWLSLHYYGAGNDYWDINREAAKEYALLLQHPGEYFSNIFSSGYDKGYGGVFDSFNSFWNDLRNNLVIKLVSVFNLLSGGNYYINSLFYNLLVFFGHLGLYRLFIDIYPAHKWKVLAGTFLLPSTLYFSSGINRDGLVFLLLALVVYIIYFAFRRGQISIGKLCLLLFSMVLLFFLRNYLVLALLPALAGWWLGRRMGGRKVFLVYAAVYLAAGLVLFGIHKLLPGVQPLRVIVQKQADYLQLPASATSIPLDTLAANPAGFIRNAPQALNHAWLRPYPLEWPSLFLVPMSIELLVYQLLVLLFLIRGLRSPQDSMAFLGFCIFFLAGIFLFIGYITPNLGALVRYRSLFWPLLITHLLCRIDWNRVGKSLK